MGKDKAGCNKGQISSTYILNQFHHLMLVIKDLNKSYDTGKSKLHVLKGIDLTIEEGEFVSIMGSSGSGKSTLLNIIGILDEKDSGVYNLDGIPIEDLSEIKAAEYRSKFLGFIFQSFNLIGYKLPWKMWHFPSIIKVLDEKKEIKKP